MLTPETPAKSRTRAMRRAKAADRIAERIAEDEREYEEVRAAEAIDESKPSRPRPHMQPDYAARLSDLRNAWAEGYAEGPF